MCWRGFLLAIIDLIFCCLIVRTRQVFKSKQRNCKFHSFTEWNHVTHILLFVPLTSDKVRNAYFLFQVFKVLSHSFSIWWVCKTYHSAPSLCFLSCILAFFREFRYNPQKETSRRVKLLLHWGARFVAMFVSLIFKAIPQPKSRLFLATYSLLILHLNRCDHHSYKSQELM